MGGLIFVLCFSGAGGGNDIQWCFSQVKGAVDDDVAEGKSNLSEYLFFFPPASYSCSLGRSLSFQSQLYATWVYQMDT